LSVRRKSAGLWLKQIIQTPQFRRRALRALAKGRRAKRRGASAGTAEPQSWPIGRMGQFLHDVRAEMKRVSWPTATTCKNTTIITLIAVIFFAVYLFLVDQNLVAIDYWGSGLAD
jgi:preprotein translocase SecE subunit